MWFSHGGWRFSPRGQCDHRRLLAKAAELRVQDVLHRDIPSRVILPQGAVFAQVYPPWPSENPSSSFPVMGAPGPPSQSAPHPATNPPLPLGKSSLVTDRSLRPSGTNLFGNFLPGKPRTLEFLFPANKCPLRLILCLECRGCGAGRQGFLGRATAALTLCNVIAG